MADQECKRIAVLTSDGDAGHERRDHGRITYPANWERRATTRDRVSFRVRPIRPDDEERERRFISRLSPESRYRRLMNAIKELPPALLNQLVHVDYNHDMAFVALSGEPDDEDLIGIARYAQDRNGPDCEFAVVVADDWQARGVGATLMRLLFEYAHARGGCTGFTAKFLPITHR